MPNRLRLPRGALADLGRADPKLAGLIDRVGPFRLEIGKSESHLGALVRSIVYQQLSGKAAATILARLRKELGEGRVPEAHDVLAVAEARLRAAGLSRQKIASLRDLCEKVRSGALPLDRIEALDDDAVIERLVAVRGIGVWSAQMFLLFHLGRLDVWPVDDLGVRKAVARLHRREQLPGKREMAEIGEKWRPYRSIASWYLWRSLEIPGGLEADAGGW